MPNTLRQSLICALIGAIVLLVSYVMDEVRGAQIYATFAALSDTTGAWALDRDTVIGLIPGLDRDDLPSVQRANGQ